MPSIIGPKPAAEFVSGKRSTVTAVAPAKLLAVNWVDGDGQKHMALAIQFGKDTEDNGQPGVFILADEAEMSTQLKIANKVVKAGVRAWLAQQENTPEGDIPSSLAMIDDGSPVASVEEAGIGGMKID